MDTNMEVPFAAAASEKKLSLGTKFSYGIGDFASNMSWTLVSSFLMFYYTDVYGLSIVVISMLLLITGVWDAVLDPIMGLIMERTKSKYGRFRPYLLYAPVIMAIANVAMFRTPSFGVTGKIVYAYVTYILLVMAYTVVNVPYGALATVMTRDHDERTTLNSFRMFASSGAMIMIGAITMPLIKILGNGNLQKGFFFMALLYSVVAIPLFWMVFINCREVITPSEKQKLTLMGSFKCVFKNPPLILVYFLGFFTLSAVFGRMGMLLYYCSYNLKNQNLFAVFMMVTGIATLSGIMAAPYMSKSLGKKMSAITSCLVGIIGLLTVYFSDYSNITLITIGTIIYGLTSFGFPLLFSMTADCADYAEWKFDVRAEGFIYAGTSLSTKLASAFAGSVCLLFIGFFGYVPNAEQSAGAIRGINIATNLIPAGMLALAILPMIFYKIDRDFHHKIVTEVNAKK